MATIPSDVDVGFGPGVAPPEPTQQQERARQTPVAPNGVVPASLQPHTLPQDGPKPYPPWMKQATPQDVQDYEKYIANGGLPEKISIPTRIAVSLAKDPEFLFHRENADAFNEFWVKPQEQSYNPVEAGLEALHNLPGGLVKAGQDVGKALGNTLKTDWDSIDYLIKRATGLSPSFRSTGQLRDARAQDIANLTGGVGQIGADLQNAFEGSLLLGGKTANSFIQAQTDLGQKTKDDLAREVLYAKQEFASDVFHSSQYSTNVKNYVADLYKATGVAGKTSEALRNKDVDPDTAAGYNQLGQFVGMEGLGKVASMAAKPTFMEQALRANAKYLKASAVAKQAALDAVKDPTLQAASKAAYDAQQQALLDLQKAQKALQDNVNNSGSLNIGGKLLQAGGATSTFLSKLPDLIETGPRWLAKKVSMGNTVVQPVLERFFERAVDYLGFEALGPLHALTARLALGGVKGTFGTAGELMTAMGQEGMGASIIPYWQRVAQRMGNGVPRNIALTLDRPSIYVLGDAVKGGAAGAATGGFLGGVGNPNDPVGGAVGGAGFGGIAGAWGGGFGQLMAQRDPATTRTLMMGDWDRYRKTLSGSDRKFFDELNPLHQLMIGSFMAKFPGVKVNYFNDPNAIGGHAPMDGTSNIWINTATKKQSIAPLLGHELGHQAAFNAILPDIYDALLGNPSLKQPGQYTLLDKSAPDGVAHIDPDTGRYVTNGTWDALKQEYINKLSGLKDEFGRPVDVSHLSEEQFAKEIYSEHQAEYLMSGNHIVDTMSAANPYWLGRGNQIKEALLTLGVGFDRNSGNIAKGSGIFDQGFEKNSQLMGLAQQFYSAKFREGNINAEEAVTHKITPEQLRDPNVRATMLDSAPEFVRNSNGEVVMNGVSPLTRSRGEVQKTMSNMGAAMDKAVSQLSADDKLAINLKQTGQNTYEMRYMPDNMLEEVVKENQNNTTQANNLRTVNKNLADVNKQGATYSFFYQKGNGQFEGAYRDLTPMLIEKTKHGNINIKGVDFNQLTSNFVKSQKRPAIKDIWGSVGDFVKDANTYFQNHAQGLPGESNGLGVTKKNALDILTGVNKTGNPLKGEVKASPIIKSFRIDRINRLRETGSIPFTGEEQYNMMASNFAPKDLKVAEANPHLTELMGDTGGIKGDTNMIPTMFSNAYLTKPGTQKLADYIDSGKVAELGDKIVQEYHNDWSKDPDAMAGMGWYKRMTPLLKSFFGDDAGLFTKLLAASSARQNPIQNFKDALQAYTRYKLGHYDDIIEHYKATGNIEDWMKPRRLNNAKMGLNSDRVLEVLAGTWESKGPKTPNYNTNLLGTGRDATIDTWTYRTLARLAGHGDWIANAAPDNLEFAIGQHAFAHAAKKLGMDADDLQAISWYGEQKRWGSKPESYEGQMRDLMEHGNPYLEGARAKGPQTKAQLQ